MLKITFLGHSAFQITDGESRLLIDPFLTGNPTAAVKPEDVKTDYILLTHGHGDHLGDAISIAKANNATIITSFELATYCSAKGCTVHPMAVGGAFKFPFGRVKLTIAHHGSGIDAGDGTTLYLGNPTGLIITIDDKTIYHAGDTGLFLDMKLIGEIDPIDVALLPIGDNFTMGIADAVKAVEFLKPKLTVPMHYKTFDVIDVDPNDFVEKVAAIGFEAQIIEIGKAINI